jgi:antitoxin component of MazEF toxin-antitoxin module
MEVYLGEYSVTKSGNSLKLTIPKTVIDNWKLSTSDKLKVYFSKDEIRIVRSDNR